MKLFGQEKIFGMDVLVLKNQILALYMNLYAWIVSTFIPVALQPKYAVPPTGSSCCVSIQGPGGLDQVGQKHIFRSMCTVLIRPVSQYCNFTYILLL